MLSLFTRLAQSDLDMKMGITLYLGGGAVISGVLVGRNDWLDLWAAASERNASTPEAVATVVERMRNAFKTGPDEAASEPVHYAYIHLTAAVVLSGGKLFPAGVDGLWRGRLSQVAGWSFGVASDA